MSGPFFSSPCLRVSVVRFAFALVVDFVFGFSQGRRGFDFALPKKSSVSSVPSVVNDFAVDFSFVSFVVNSCYNALNGRNPHPGTLHNWNEPESERDAGIACHQTGSG